MTQEAFRITEVDEMVLRALARFHYLTAAQASRLLYPNLNDGNRYMQRRFQKLATGGYVLRLGALPKPQYGQAPHVFTLASNGRKYLQGAGVAVRPYFRPDEEKRIAWNSPFMKHRLAAIDVMIAADRLCRDVPRVTCPRMVSERELKRGAVRVDVPPSRHAISDGPRKVAVIPDAWFQLRIEGRSPRSFAIELDRATEDQKVWREKVAAYVVWAGGPYKEAFETDNLTIAIACPDDRRCVVLMDWTMRGLKSRELDEYAQLFVFTGVSPVEATPARFFFGKVWKSPDSETPVSLLQSPHPMPEGKGVVFQTV